MLLSQLQLTCSERVINYNMIIAITGTLGSGKGTVVDYLVNKRGFTHYSVPAFIREEVARRGLPDNRDSMHIVGNALRAEHSPGYIVDQLYEKAIADGGSAVIESIRSIGEVTSLKSKSNPVFMLAIDADPTIRYERVLQRKSYKDSVSFEKFVADEAREMNDPDPNGMNISGCIKLADAIIINDGTIEELHDKIEKLMNSFQK